MVHKSLYCHHFCFADRNPSSKRLSDLPKVPSSFVQGPDLRCVVRLQSCEFTHCPVPRLHSDCPGQCPQGAQGVDKHVDNYSTWQWNMRRTSGTHVQAGRAPALAPRTQLLPREPRCFSPKKDGAEPGCWGWSGSCGWKWATRPVPSTVKGWRGGSNSPLTTLDRGRCVCPDCGDRQGVSQGKGLPPLAHLSWQR